MKPGPGSERALINWLRDVMRQEDTRLFRTAPKCGPNELQLKDGLSFPFFFFPPCRLSPPNNMNLIKQLLRKRLPRARHNTKLGTQRVK